MSNIPENVYFLEAALKDMEKLEGHQRRLVLKALCRIARSPRDIGKSLGNRAGTDLTGLRSLSVDKKNLRIVWRVVSAEVVEIVLVIIVGPRGDEEVYNIAARRKAAALELEQIIRTLVLTDKT